jgi:pyrimidine operon attenuation protein/uracil phosphoribosyltransferase
MRPKTILNSKHFELAINRLCYQLIENHNDFSNTALVGLQPRGVYVLDRIKSRLQEITKNNDLKTGVLDITFYRDDFRRRDEPISAEKTEIDFLLEGKNVVLIDDVLFTGRTIRAGMDALLAYGRPSKVELLVFIDRRFSRHLPIQPNYIGKTVDSISEERVEVKWKEIDKEDKVILYSSTE